MKVRSLRDRRAWANSVSRRPCGFFAGIMSACFAYGLAAAKPISLRGAGWFRMAGEICGSVCQLWWSCCGAASRLTCIWCGGCCSGTGLLGNLWEACATRSGCEEDDGAEYVRRRCGGCCGISNSSFIRWARPRWGDTIFRAGLCIWRGRSCLRHCGAQSCMSGRALGGRLAVGARILLLVLSTVVVGYGNYLKAR